MNPTRYATDIGAAFRALAANPEDRELQLALTDWVQEFAPHMMPLVDHIRRGTAQFGYAPTGLHHMGEYGPFRGWGASEWDGNIQHESGFANVFFQPEPGGQERRSLNGKKPYNSGLVGPDGDYRNHLQTSQWGEYPMGWNLRLPTPEAEGLIEALQRGLVPPERAQEEPDALNNTPPDEFGDEPLGYAGAQLDDDGYPVAQAPAPIPAPARQAPRGAPKPQPANQSYDDYWAHLADRLREMDEWLYPPAERSWEDGTPPVEGDYTPSGVDHFGEAMQKWQDAQPLPLADYVPTQAAPDGTYPIADPIYPAGDTLPLAGNAPSGDTYPLEQSDSPWSDYDYYKHLGTKGLQDTGPIAREADRRLKAATTPAKSPQGGQEPHWTDQGGYHPSWGPNGGKAPVAKNEHNTHEGSWDWLKKAFGYERGTSPVNYGWDEDREGFLNEIHQNPIDPFGHGVHADFLEDQLGGDHPDVRFRRDLSEVLGIRTSTPWVDKVHQVGGSGFPLDPTVRGFSPGNIPRHTVAGMPQDQSSWHTRSLLPARRDNPETWRWSNWGTTWMGQGPFDPTNSPYVGHGDWLVNRGWNPDEDTYAHEASNLTPAELGAYDFTNPEDIDPAIWPQIEALLRGNWDRHQHFAEEEEPLEYAKRKGPPPPRGGNHPFVPSGPGGGNPGGYTNHPRNESMWAHLGSGGFGGRATWPPEWEGEQPPYRTRFAFQMIPSQVPDQHSVWVPSNQGVQRVVPDSVMDWLMMPQHETWGRDDNGGDDGIYYPMEPYDDYDFELQKSFMRPLTVQDMFRTRLWESPFSGVLNDPDDWQGRGVYADWLEETHPEFGEGWPAFERRAAERIRRRYETQGPWKDLMPLPRVPMIHPDNGAPFPNPEFTDDTGAPYSRTARTDYADFPVRMISDVPILPRVGRRKRKGDYFGYEEDTGPVDYADAHPKPFPVYTTPARSTSGFAPGVRFVSRYNPYPDPETGAWYWGYDGTYGHDEDVHGPHAELLDHAQFDTLPTETGWGGDRPVQPEYLWAMGLGGEPPTAPDADPREVGDAFGYSRTDYGIWDDKVLTEFPADTTPLWASAEWFHDNAQPAEAEFRMAAAEHLRERMAKGWDGPPKVDAEGNLTDTDYPFKWPVLSPFFDNDKGWPAWAGQLQPGVLEESLRAQHPDYFWAIDWPNAAFRMSPEEHAPSLDMDPESPEYQAQARQMRQRYPGLHTRRLTPAENAYGGITDISKVSGDEWLEIINMMRQRRSELGRFEDDDEPVAYADAGWNRGEGYDPTQKLQDGMADMDRLSRATAYGLAEDMAHWQQQIAADPLDANRHLSMADWLRDNDQDQEGDYRHAVGESVQRRMQTPWTGPELTSRHPADPMFDPNELRQFGWLKQPHTNGPLDPFAVPVRPSPNYGGVFWNSWPNLGDHDLGPHWYFGAGPDIGNPLNVSGAVGIGEITRQRRAGTWPGTSPEWVREMWEANRDPADDLSPAEMAFAGIHDFQNIDPRIWPQIEALMRHQHGRGQRLESGDSPTAYGQDDVEPFRQNVINPRPLDTFQHRVLADMMQDDLGEEHPDVLFRRQLADSLDRRLSVPWAPPGEREGGIDPESFGLVQPNQWGPQDAYLQRMWSSVVPSMATVRSYHPTQWDGGDWAWIENPEAAAFRSQIDVDDGTAIPMTSDETPGDFLRTNWLTARVPRAHELDPLRSRWSMFPEERLYAGIDDLSGIDPALWPHLEALMRRQFDRGQRLESGDSPTPYGDREALEAQLDVTPLESDVHLRLADWYRENGMEPEGAFREKVGRSVQQRMNTPWFPPFPATASNGTNWLDDWEEDRPQLRAQVAEQNQWQGSSWWPGVFAPGWNQSNWADDRTPDWRWQILDSETQRDRFPNFPSIGPRGTIEDVARVYGIDPNSAMYPWWFQNEAPLEWAQPLNAAHRAFAGITDPREIDGALWPQVEALMRRANQQGVRFEEDDEPVDYSDTYIPEWEPSAYDCGYAGGMDGLVNPTFYPPNARTQRPVPYDPEGNGGDSGGIGGEMAGSPDRDYWRKRGTNYGDREDERAFLSGIRSDPLDITQQLVFSDWLADRDRTKDAEFQKQLADWTQSRRDWSPPEYDPRGFLRQNDRAFSDYYNTRVFQPIHDWDDSISKKMWTGILEPNTGIEPESGGTFHRWYLNGSEPRRNEQELAEFLRLPEGYLPETRDEHLLNQHGGRDLTSAERLMAGINDLNAVDWGDFASGPLWDRVRGLLRNRFDRGQRLEEDDVPTEYGLADDEAGFRTAIEENPYELNNHLAFADWLQEQGQEGNAEFRRAMAAWIQSKGENGLGDADSSRWPWFVPQESALPSGVLGENIPRWDWNPDDPDTTFRQGGRFYPVDPVEADSVFDADRPENPYLEWQTYPNMEDALYVAWLRGRGANFSRYARDSGLTSANRTAYSGVPQRTEYAMSTNYGADDWIIASNKLRSPEGIGLRVGTAPDMFERQVYADMLQDMGRDREAALLRDPRRHVIVNDDGTVVPGRHTLTDLWDAARQIDWDGNGWEIHADREHHADWQDFRPEDTYDPEGFSVEPRAGRVRFVDTDREGFDEHGFTDVPVNELPTYLRDVVEDAYNNWVNGFDDPDLADMHGDVFTQLEALGNAPWEEPDPDAQW